MPGMRLLCESRIPHPESRLSKHRPPAGSYQIRSSGIGNRL
jgi:hypothetical protein